MTTQSAERTDDWVFPSAETERQARWNAARLLDAARWCDPESGLELLDWVLTVVPHSRPARRLQIERLLQTGHLDDAEARLARGLLQWPRDRRLRLLRCRCLAEIGRPDSAREALDSLLRDRPNDREALLLAASLDCQAGRWLQAIIRLEQLLARHPDDEVAHIELIETFLAAGQIELAADAIERLTDPPRSLAARVLAAQGQMLDALQMVSNCNPADDPESFGLRLRWLIQTSNLEAARLLLEDVQMSEPAVCLHAACGWLNLGRFAMADRLARQAAESPVWRRQALEVRIVAGTLTEDAEVAAPVEDVFAEWHRHATAADRRRLAGRWLEGFRGELIADQHDAVKAGADPVGSVLEPLLADALMTLEASSDDGASTGIGIAGNDIRSANRDEPIEHVACIDRCRVLLGLSPSAPPDRSRRDLPTAA